MGSSTSLQNMVALIVACAVFAFQTICSMVNPAVTETIKQPAGMIIGCCITLITLSERKSSP